MKLHLGCGQRYLEGYVNIDFPASEHTIQASSIADLHADLRELRYLSESVEEVRLHHVFEHFPRPIACGLLASWYSWLGKGGRLHLEVPDFQKMSRILLDPLASFQRKAIAERHIFGSHEAQWAAHCEGYTQKMLKYLVGQFGFRVLETRASSWMGTYNFELIAEKHSGRFTQDDAVNSARSYLRNFLVDDSESESSLFNVWILMFSEQIRKSWAE
jgi:hypothetical protein